MRTVAALTVAKGIFRVEILLEESPLSARVDVSLAMSIAALSHPSSCTAYGQIGMSSADSIHYESLYDSLSLKMDGSVVIESLNDLGRDKVETNLISELNSELSDKRSYHSTKVPSNMQQANNSSTHRFAGEDNYMLKSCDSSRPRSASLSQVSRLSQPPSGQSQPQPTASLGGPRSLPAASNGLQQPTNISQPPSFILQEVANSMGLSACSPSAAIAGSNSCSSPAIAAFICSCLPSCCCKCTLLSSFTDCQSVYHHVCARFTQSQPEGQVTCSPGDSPADTVPPPTVPQDVVSSKSIFTLSLRTISLNVIFFLKKKIVNYSSR